MAEKPYFKAYRHNKIRRFKVGPFEFEDHILKIQTEEENEQFVQLHEQLHPRDRNAIVEILNLENTRKVGGMKTIRGAADTTSFKDARDKSGDFRDSQQQEGAGAPGQPETPLNTPSGGNPQPEGNKEGEAKQTPNSLGGGAKSGFSFGKPAS